MFDVEIFVETDIKGPCLKDGKYAAVLVFAKRDGQKVTREVYGAGKKTTFNRMAIEACVKSLKVLRAECNVTIYTDCNFLVNMVERGTPQRWNRQEWKTVGGKEIKNKDMWQQLDEQMKKQTVKFEAVKWHEYTKELKDKMAAGGKKYV